jgi:hypothetical protein
VKDFVRGLDAGVKLGLIGGVRGCGSEEAKAGDLQELFHGRIILVARVGYQRAQ